MSEKLNKSNIILYDQDTWIDFLPLTYTRPIGALRIGIFTIADKWARYVNATISFKTKDYLAVKYPLHTSDVNLCINSVFLPSPALVHKIQDLPLMGALMYQDEWVAMKLPNGYVSIDTVLFDQKLIKIDITDTLQNNITKLNSITDLYTLNRHEISKDCLLLSGTHDYDHASNFNVVFGSHPLYLGRNLKMKAVILNTTDGPIHIGDDVEIMEGSMLRGPLSIGHNSVIKMGAKIYGNTTIGPYCKIGGEINNSIFLAHTNKSHDGYLGNSVLGEWVNLGANTNNSNLKNNYGEIKLWSYREMDYMGTGQQFCGVFIGDHSKTGINTMLNSGTCIGVSCNLFGLDYMPKMVPSFSWGGANEIIEYRFEEAVNTAQKVYQRRDLSIDDIEISILKAIKANNIM